MKKMFGAVIFITAVLSACVTVDEKQIFDKPAFNNSHAILIEKTIREVPVQDLFSENIRAAEKVIVAPIEDVFNDRTGLVPLIEDNLIYNLTEADYAVLEREDRVLLQLEREQGRVYKAFAERNLPISPVLRLIKEMDTQGLDYLDFNKVLAASERSITINGDDAKAALDMIDPVIYKQIIEFYKTLDASYFEKQALAATDVELQTADVLVSYRVLECGIFIDLEETEFKREKQSLCAQLRLVKPEMLKNNKYTREANTRMFVRIVDAGSGEIRGAKLVENINTDTIEYKQGENETRNEYATRMRRYEELLAKYHYTYYDQQFPLQRAKTDQEIYEKSLVNDDKNEDGFLGKISTFFGGEAKAADSTESLSLSAGSAGSGNDEWKKILVPVGIGLLSIGAITGIVFWIID